MLLHLFYCLNCYLKMAFNLACGISDRNDTFVKKGFIITCCFLRACTCRIAFPSSAAPSFINIYSYRSWLLFLPLLPPPPLWTTVSLRVVTLEQGNLEVRVMRPLHGEVICMYELGRCFCRYVTGLLETI